MTAARIFLRRIIDYAGLFPPASQSMGDAVRSYSNHVNGDDSTLLGRFIVPASRLDEFTTVAGGMLPRGAQSEPWRLSVIADTELEAGREALLHFNCSHWKRSELGHAVCDAIEKPVSNAGEIEAAIAAFPDFFQLFLEVPIASDPAQLIGVMAGKNAAAKIRTGGVTADSIPASDDIVRFLKSCRSHKVPFKATAGLHHPIRAQYPLTYESGAPCAEMFGYLNVFVAAALIDSGVDDDDTLRRVLEERDPRAFAFDDAGAAWKGHRLSAPQLAHARDGFALSFGSCSFTEPVVEARELGLI